MEDNAREPSAERVLGWSSTSGGPFKHESFWYPKRLMRAGAGSFRFRFLSISPRHFVENIDHVVKHICAP